MSLIKAVLIRAKILLRKLCKDFRGNFLEFLWREFELLTTEVCILLCLEWDEVDMGVRHFEAQHDLSYLFTGEGCLDGFGHTLGEGLITGQLVIVHIEEVIHFATRDHEGVTLHQRVDVEECIELLVLGTLVAGNLTSSNLTEYIHLVIYDLRIYDLQLITRR